jgi:ribosomal protein L37AE/L43A
MSVPNEICSNCSDKTRLHQFIINVRVCDKCGFMFPDDGWIHLTNIALPSCIKIGG